MLKTVVLASVLVAFGAVTFHAIASYGYVGYFEALASNLASIHATLDVVIALSLVLFWMWGDARERGLPFYPYAVVGLFLGSLGPLAYLIHRELSALRAPRRATA